uniref:DDE Tnp4 domain-containing protein n=1 Tax=Cyprinodon variegatus TaxID=28743 RepID=A0A3Q2DAP4_CYPVA
MPPAMFDKLLARVGQRITTQYTFYRVPLEPVLKLALTLHHLAFWNLYASMKLGWRVLNNTQVIVLLVCPTTPDGWHAIADSFLQRRNFPHTCGALDGKHVAVRCAARSVPSILTIKDSTSLFFWCLWMLIHLGSLGGTGPAPDEVGASFLKPLPNENQDAPYFFIGDDAFVLRTTMMKPYSPWGLTNERHIFNYCLSRARREAGNLSLIVSKTTEPAACLDRGLKPGLCSRSMARGTKFGGPNTAFKDGKKQRNPLKPWINSPAGAVPWQDYLNDIYYMFMQ